MATRRRRHRSARHNPQSILSRLVRRHRHARRNSWPDNAAGHATAARLGWKHRRGRKGRAKRHNPSWASYMPNPFTGRRTRRHTRRRNPMFRRTHRRTYRRNPFALRRLLPSGGMLRTSVKLGLGITAGFVSMPIVNEVMLKCNLQGYTKYAGAGQILLGSLMAGLIRNRHAKDIGLMIAAFGVYDLVQQNVLSQYLPAIPRTSGLLNSILPSGMFGTSYGVARRPVSRVAGRAAMSASYQPSLSSSYDTASSAIVGLAGDHPALGHLPGIDFDME